MLLHSSPQEARQTFHQLQLCTTAAARNPTSPVHAAAKPSLLPSPIPPLSHGHCQVFDIKEEVEDKELVYPSYYTRAFHGG